MSTRGAAAVIAGLVLAIGLVVGFLPHSIVGDSVFPTISCGSAFAPSNDAKTTDIGAGLAGVTRDYESQCGDALTAPRAIALSLLGVGLLGLVFLGLTAAAATRRSAVDEEADRDAASS